MEAMLDWPARHSVDNRLRQLTRRDLVKLCLLAIVCALHGAASARPTADFACSLAPSQSSAASAVVASMGGAGAATAAVGQALGMTVVTHSSGAAILTGSGGYIAGTIGAASAAPFLITVGVVAVTGATALEIVCAPRNHPEQVARVQEAGARFAASFRSVAGSVRSAAVPRIEKTSVALKRLKGDVFDYVFRRSKSASQRDRPVLATPQFNKG
jgi:hypothetical protein